MRRGLAAAALALAVAACQPVEPSDPSTPPARKGGSGGDLFETYGITTDPTEMTGLGPPPDCLWHVHIRDGSNSGYLCPGDPGYDDPATG